MSGSLEVKVLIVVKHSATLKSTVSRWPYERLTITTSVLFAMFSTLKFNRTLKITNQEHNYNILRRNMLVGRMKP